MNEAVQQSLQRFLLCHFHFFSLPFGAGGVAEKEAENIEFVNKKKKINKFSSAQSLSTFVQTEFLTIMNNKRGISAPKSTNVAVTV